MKNKVFSILCAFIILMGVAISMAQVPQLINYQGYLTDSGGIPVDGQVSILFSVYDVSTGGTALWSETQNVDVAEGLFNVLLGSLTPIPLSLFNGTERYLALTVGSDPEMEPRKQLVSVGYAFRANKTDSLDGYDAASFVRSVDGVPPNSTGDIDFVEGSNVTITPDAGNNTITISAAGGGGGGDITAVNAGTGLTGGGTSGDVTLGIELPLLLQGEYTGILQLINDWYHGTCLSAHSTQTSASLASDYILLTDLGQPPIPIGVYGSSPYYGVYGEGTTSGVCGRGYGGVVYMGMCPVMELLDIA